MPLVRIILNNFSSLSDLRWLPVLLSRFMCFIGKEIMTNLITVICDESVTYLSVKWFFESTPKVCFAKHVDFESEMGYVSFISWINDQWRPGIFLLNQCFLNKSYFFKMNLTGYVFYFITCACSSKGTRIIFIDQQIRFRSACLIGALSRAREQKLLDKPFWATVSNKIL